MNSLDSIDALIFDLGGVILNLDISLTFREFQRHIPELDPLGFVGKREQLPFFNSYEIGKISTDEFMKSFNGHYQKDITPEDFRICWSAMILDLPRGRIELIRSLRAKGKKVFLLSNINQLHELAVQEKFGEMGEVGNFLSLFDHGYYSHHIGLRKPNPEVFHFVLGQQGLRPERTLFIDDSIHHIEGAKKVGINALHLAEGQSLENLSIF